MIRWIRADLGTAPYDHLGQGDFTLLDARHLVDKAGNPSFAIIELINEGLSNLRAGKKVVVACDFGISRSNSIAAGILSLAEGRSLDSAVEMVVAATGETAIKIEMIESIRQALEPSPIPMDRQNILITGSTGFLGRNLLSLMSSNPKIVAPDKATLDLEHGPVELARFCNKHNIGQIVHLAYPRAYTNPDSAGTCINILRTVLDTAKTQDIRVIFISGWVVFSGYHSTALIADEAMAMRPMGAYGDAKFLEEALVRTHIERGDLRATIARFPPVYGPGGDRPRLIRTFHKKIVTGEIIQTHRFKNGRPALDLLHVTDAVEAIRLLINLSKNDTFHFGSGTLTETFDIAKRIADISGCPLRHGEINIDQDIGNVAMTYEKARKQLGWRPTISLDVGLAQMLGAET